MTRQIIGTFENDTEKLFDLLQLSKEDFLQSYSYIHEVDYEKTLSMFKVAEHKTQEENEETIENLAYMLRGAENMYIEELNERPTGCSITGSQFKEAIYDYVDKTLNETQKELFYELCEAMAC
jgi:hypothetical protein